MLLKKFQCRIKSKNRNGDFSSILFYTEKLFHNLKRRSSQKKIVLFISVYFIQKHSLTKTKQRNKEIKKEINK